MQRNKKPKR